MSTPILSKRSALVVGVVGVALSLLVVFFLTSGQIPQNSEAAKSVGSIQNVVTPESTSSGLPVRLKIPAINLDAAIESVDLTPDGAMGVPRGIFNVAWFKLGPRPGEKGSAVIDGHYGWKDGKAAVFDDLHKLQPGDKLLVEDDKGATTAFVVRASRRYDPQADAAEVFSSSDNQSHLNLVTCDGSWNKFTQTYSQRLVVFTDKE